MAESEKSKDKKKKMDRREFLVGSTAALAAGAAMAAGVPGTARASSRQSYPKSKGYIVHDSRLCWGCQSCMFACSSAHYGEANPTLSRIQIIRDAPSFTKYPLDIVMSLCRQCDSPLCVENCPTGACHIDTRHGNVRVIDQKACIGCKMCIHSCPHRPHRTVWDPYIGKSSKCDLCIDSPYWNKNGGPDGEPACVSICPSKALKLVHETPNQEDIEGYDVDLAPPAPKFPWWPGAKPARKPSSKS